MRIRNRRCNDCRKGERRQAMNEWFECSVRYEKTLENGMQKYVSEPYLVEALSFTEAEQRFIEEIQPFMSGDYEVKAVAKRKISELFEDDKELADSWFKCKVAFVTLDERNGIEKRKMQTIMVQASDLRCAVKRLDRVLECIMADYEIVSVSETAIMDVFHYKEKEASHGE